MNFAILGPHLASQRKSFSFSGRIATCCRDPHRRAPRDFDGQTHYLPPKQFIAMIAIALDPAVAPVGVAGRGPAALRRFVTLCAGAAHQPLLFSDRPDGMEVPADALRTRLPWAAD